MKNKNRKCAYIGECKKRSWLKSLVWRLIGIFILGAITWSITHNWEQTSIITIIFHVVRLVMYYFHERIWENVQWGRIKYKEQVDMGEGI
jgi:uncharacterized membrane protein